MNIAFLVHGNSLSGGNFVIYRQAQFLRSKGHNVTMLFNSVDRTNRIHFPGYRLKSFLYWDAVRFKHQFDICIATWWESFYYLHRVNAKHYFYFCQSDERRFYNEIDNLIFKDEMKSMVRLSYEFKEVGFITEARWIRDTLSKEFGLTFAYAPNGVDQTIFNQKVKGLANKPKDKLRFLVEGYGTVPFKRVPFAFKALKPFRDQIEVWYIAGDGYCDKDWKPDRFFKRLPLDQMAPVYRSCDVLIKLSTVEGVFGPPLEMMACGGTAIVSKVTGYDEYIKNGYNALAVPCDDLNAVREAIRKVISKGRPYVSMLARNGLKTARDWDWKKQLPKFEKGLKQLQKQVPIVNDELRATIKTLERMKYSLQGTKIPRLNKNMKKNKKAKKLSFL